MSVYTNPPEWEAQGKKPPSSKRTEGWKPGDRVPASWLNWFWFSTVNSLREIAQAFVSHRDSTSGIHGVPEGETIATKRYVDGRADGLADRLDAHIDGLADRLDAHIADKNNPHGVTAEQIGATPSDAAIPVGGIIMWSGSVDSIPPGWALCDGRNGTPDLRDRFIVGAGGSYNVGNRGGSNTVTLTTSQIPSHSHTASSGSSGTHNHTGTTSVKEIAAGLHPVAQYHRGARNEYSPLSGTDMSAVVSILPGAANTNHSHTFTTSSNGSHSHSITISSTGGGQAHENRPPYYALCFIMKL